MMLASGQVCYGCSKAGTSPLWCSFGVTWRHTAARAAMGAEAEAPEAEAEADTDLADEHEHVERAGLGQVHHKGAVEDGQAAAPASSNHGATAVQHKADGQQARDEQQQQRSGRREGRMQHECTMEPMSPHASPPRAARAIDRSGISPSREIYYLSINRSSIFLPLHLS